MGPCSYRGTCAIYSKRIKPQLKREVNNETFFTSLRSYYQIDYIACYTQYIYYFLLKTGMLHEILTYINVYIFKVGMPPSHPLIFPFDPLECVKCECVVWSPWNVSIKMSCGELTGDLKTSREESLTKHVGFVYVYAKKAENRKVNDEKGGDKQKKQEW